MDTPDDSDLYDLLGDISGLGISEDRVSIVMYQGKNGEDPYATFSFPELNKKKGKILLDDIENAIENMDLEVNPVNKDWEEGTSAFLILKLKSIIDSPSYIADSSEAGLLSLLNEISFKITKVQLILEGKKESFQKKSE